MRKILQLISSSYSEKESKNYDNFKPKSDDIKILIEAAKEALTIFPNIPGACFPLSSFLASLIRDNTNYPIHAIAGSLYIDNEKVFDNENDDFKSLFKSTNLDWDGHCWIIFGNYLCDISICRTAYSKYAPIILKNKILSMMGEGKGIFICPVDKLLDYGLNFIPKYVLTNKEISIGFNSAFYLINNKNKDS
ncbi:MAG: hypothetical protein WA916_03775 [Arcobacter sp.]|uniref:hypothetical protein n=1 Tax=Arcobacter sp. TaxID=1872629 RepID=UPI003C762535